MAETDEEQVMEEGYLTKEERFDRAREKMEYARSLEAESEAKKGQAKHLSDQAKGARGEAEALLCDRAVARPKENPQLAIPEPDPTVCPENDEGVHDWVRLRETDGVFLEQCEECDHERTAKIPETEGVVPAWVYLPHEVEAPAEPVAPEPVAS